MARRSTERTLFLSDLLSDAMYYPWFRLLDADWEKGTATIKVQHDHNYWQTHHVGPDDVARGLRMYREWLEGKRETYPGQWATGFGRSEGERATKDFDGWDVVKADRTNGDEGGYDADIADGVLQFALLGHMIWG